jgi:hypothetical protein
MNNPQNETNDLALLAGMVKGNMRKIDSLMTDLSDRRADNIDIHKFINAPQSPVNEVHSENSQQPSNMIVDTNPQHVHTIPAQTRAVDDVVDEEIKHTIESIKLTLERINGNLTKLTGMFGKVFQSLNSKKNG